MFLCIFCCFVLIERHRFVCCFVLFSLVFKVSFSAFAAEAPLHGLGWETKSASGGLCGFGLWFYVFLMGFELFLIGFLHF